MNLDRMRPIEVICDRCGATVKGLQASYGTAGFYNVLPASIWAKYANEGEQIICDACMWADARYLADYPPTPSA